MPEPFKNLFNAQLITAMAHHFKRVWQPFKKDAFITQAIRGLDALELKQRSSQITRAMECCLPSTFSESAPILVRSLHPADDEDISNQGMDERGIRGWATMPMCEFVGLHGLEEFELGLSVQRELTKRGSAEFGVRHFILKDQAAALATLTRWAKDPNYHVRRLASEGSRPRLPWAMRLPTLIGNPAPLFPLLNLLKDDPTEYVRRSVANALNDIAKDHPDDVAAIATTWLEDASRERHKLVRHACRTLIKQGHEKALTAFGYHKPEHLQVQLALLTPVVQFGDALQFTLDLRSEATVAQALVVDYIIHHRKANGKTSPKVFKWKTVTVEPGGSHSAHRRHSIKLITTRTYYPGTHRLEVVVNGESQDAADFELDMLD